MSKTLMLVLNNCTRTSVDAQALLMDSVRSVPCGAKLGADETTPRHES
jgi:hypothetical protein